MGTKTVYTVQIGRIANGSLSDEELIRTFINALRAITNDPNNKAKLVLSATAPHDAQKIDVADLIKRAETELTINRSRRFRCDPRENIRDELVEALDAYAPENSFFGWEDDSGSDWGFWPLDRPN